MNLSHLLKIYFRNLKKDIFQNIIKIIGLTAGLSCATLVFLYIQDELNFDAQYPKHDRIYRYGAGMSIGAPQITQPTVNPAVGPVMARYIPEIENFFRYNRMGEVLIINDEEKIIEGGLAMADSSILGILSINLISGSPGEALINPYSIVIDQTLAGRIFGRNNPVGKRIEIDNHGYFTITGVMEDMADNTHLNSSGFISFHTQFAEQEEVQSPGAFFGGMNTNVFFLIRPGTEAATIDQRLLDFYDTHLSEIDPINYVSIIEPLKSYRLNSLIAPEYSGRNRAYFFSFISIGLVTLILAIINYFNISTSSSIKRSKEISLKKVNGSKASQLIFQFNLESFLTVFFALLLSIFIAHLVLAYSGINNILNKNLGIGFASNTGLWVFSLSALFIVGFLASWYPSVILSRTRPIEYLRGSYSGSSKGRALRSILVGLQFVLSVTAVIIILLMDSQLRYMINSDPGFKPKNLIIIQARNNDIEASMESFRQEILQHPGVESATFAIRFPGTGIWGTAFDWETEEGEMKIHAFPALWVDKEFPGTLGLQIIEGEDFDNYSESDSIRYFLVNESLVREMGWTSAIGKRNERGIVTGVVKDFNYNSLHTRLGGAFICLYPVPKRNLGIRIREGSESSTLEYIKERWKKMAPGIPISYSFLDDDIAAVYSSDRGQQTLLAILALITILISGFGLLGITAQSMMSKTKEVTIRKIFGAEKSQVISILFKNIVYLVGGAIIVATPLTIWLYRKWVQSFAFQVDMKIIYFLTADLAILVFALALSGYHGLQVMNSKPVDKLRYE